MLRITYCWEMANMPSIILLFSISQEGRDEILKLHTAYVLRWNLQKNFIFFSHF